MSNKKRGINRDLHHLEDHLQGIISSAELSLNMINVIRKREKGRMGRKIK